MARNITLHVFCSVKGGVGKSTLAVACAKLLAKSGRQPLVIDADLTGTSLADGMRLCAPQTTLRADGTVDVEAPPTGVFFSRAEVERLRRARRDNPTKKGLPPPYLNDALRPYLESKVEKYVGLRVDALMWREEDDDNVWFLPSSALQRDVGESLGWFGLAPYDWMGAMTLILNKVSLQWPELTDVVLDVPPGLFGFGQQMLMLARLLMGSGLPEGYPDWKNGPVTWSARAFLVTTSDANDILPVYEYMAQNATELLGVRVLLNKSTTVIPSPTAVLGPMLGAQIDLRRVVQVPLLMPTLGRIFVDGTLRIDDALKGLTPLFNAPEEAP